MTRLRREAAASLVNKIYPGNDRTMKLCLLTKSTLVMTGLVLGLVSTTKLRAMTGLGLLICNPNIHISKERLLKMEWLEKFKS